MNPSADNPVWRTNDMISELDHAVRMHCINCVKELTSLNYPASVEISSDWDDGWEFTIRANSLDIQEAIAGAMMALSELAGRISMDSDLKRRAQALRDRVEV